MIRKNTYFSHYTIKLPPALGGGKQMCTKKGFSQNRKVWLKPNSNSNKKSPAKAGGN